MQVQTVPEIDAAVVIRSDGDGAAILIATITCGTLDILSAFAFSAVDGVSPGQVLRFVASGPLGDGMRKAGALGALAGIATHYALMSIMVAILVSALPRKLLFGRRWLLVGPGYGLLIFGFMYWIVLPARFGFYPRIDAWHLGNALFSHIFCVGLPMAWIVARTSYASNAGRRA